MYLVGFRVQKKCKLKVSYFQTFRLRLESPSVRIYFYKKYKGGNSKIAHVPNKHCGENDINELHMWTYKIDLN